MSSFIILHHYSFDYDEFAFAPCPHYSYLTTIQVYESCGEKAAGAEVAIHGEKLKTDEFGRVSLFMPNGKYPLTVTTATEYAAKIVAIKGAPTTLSIWMKPLSGETTTPAITTTPVETTTETTTEPVSSGTDGLQYEFYEDYAEVVGYSGDATEVVIPAEVNGLPVTGIARDSFEDCYSLISIIIPSSVTNIGYQVFFDCYSLISIIIPSSVTNIGYQVFFDCYRLTEITVADENIFYSSKDGVLFNKEQTELICCPGGKSGIYTIPNSVASISECAFEHCDSLTNITIPDSVTSIGENAFYDCNSLTSITIPDSVTSIGGFAFAHCYNLVSITIPNSVTSIGAYVFFDCDSLTSIAIPKSVTSIGYDAFGQCDNLTSITIPNSVTSIKDLAFLGCSSITDVYYTGTEAEWNAITIGDDNDDLTNATIHYNSTASDLTTVTAEPTLYTSAPIAESYTVDVETGTLQSADFTDLTPGEIYNFYIMQSSEAETPFSGENLLYISQAAADLDGCLTVEFIPKTGFAGAELFVVGMTHPELTADTVSVQLDEITCDGTEQYLEPVVSYNGEPLICGVDYVLEGDFVITDAGEYTLTISGIGDYVGSVDVAFTVAGAADTILKGDANQDGKIDADDAYTVLVYYAEEMVGKEHTMFDTPELEEQLFEAADIDQDGDLDADDAYLILLYYARVSVGSDVTWEELTK